MIWLTLLVAVVLVVLTVAAVLGRVDGSLAEPTSTLSYVPLPDERLTTADLEALRLDTGLRGYRMDQVDEVIGRLAEEIRELRERLESVTDPARLTDPPPFAAPATVTGPAPVADPARTE